MALNEGQTKTLIEFLVEDLKDTAEHLRETDRKISLLIRLYGGAFVLVATLVLGLLREGIITFDDLAGIYSLALFIIMGLFTWWLYLFTLKGKETKQGYISRMNFLRYEIHCFLDNQRKNMLGYWTGIKPVEKNDIPKEEDYNNKSSRRFRIGLDDLYPIALGVVLFIFLLPIPVISLKLISGNRLKYDWLYMVFLTLLIEFIAYRCTKRQWRISEGNIQKQINKYNVSPEAKKPASDSG